MDRQSTSSMVMTETKTTHGTIEWLERQRNCMAICQSSLSWLPDSRACARVGHWTPDSSAMEATGSACKSRWLECCHLSMPSPRPAACAGPALVQHACIL